jgi:hypothetical protein
MAGTSSRPTRTPARRIAATLSVVFLAIIGVLCLLPVARAAEDTKAEYGTVIGIGMYKISCTIQPAWC